MSEEVAAWLLPEFMGAFVPLEIMSLEERGGPTEEEIAQAKKDWSDVLEMAEPGRFEGGAELFYRTAAKPRTKNSTGVAGTAEVAGRLVRLVACLAFAPGGIQVFGHHFVTSQTEIVLSDKGIRMPQYIYPSSVDVVALRAMAAKRRAALVTAGCATYQIGPEYKIEAIVCLCCGLGSTNPTDVNGRYCPFCQTKHSEWKASNEL